MNSVFARLNSLIVFVSSIALVMAALVLTYSVVTRYFLHLSTDWQDELSVFLIVGAVFMSSAAIQAQRGHVAIEAIVGLLGPRTNAVRQVVVDIASMTFCAYFAYKSWALLAEAWTENFHSEFDLGAAAVDPLLAHVGRHDAAQPSIAAPDRCATGAAGAAMTTLSIGLLYGAATLVAMFAGMPIAFALGAVATLFMMAFMPAASLDTITQNVYEEMASITLLSIPLFILKGAAIGQSRAGQDLYSALTCLVAPHPRRTWHRQRIRLRAVRRHGRIVAGDLLGDRFGRHPGNAQARLFRRLRRRHHRRRRHARHPAAAFDHHDPLRGRRREIARTAVSRRHRSGATAGHAVRHLCDDGNSAASTAAPSDIYARDRRSFGNCCRKTS